LFHFTHSSSLKTALALFLVYVLG